MKKLFAILLFAVISVSTLFAGTKCVYVVSANATADQNIIDYLNANGYEVTVFVANGTIPVGDYAVAVLSETIGSTANTWKAFKTAALPFVGLKTFAARGNTNSLMWLSTNNTGSDYANTTDVKVKTADATHPILDGVSADPQLLYQAVVDAVNPLSIYALQWLNFPTLPTGATVLTTVTIGTGTSYTITGDIPQTIAFNRGTVMNNNTLLNRAVICGINNFANAQITPDGMKIIKQACDWVVAGGIANAIENSVAESLLKRVDDVLANPTNLDVAIYTSNGKHVMSSNSSVIKLNALKPGVYVVKTKSVVLKIVL